MKKTSVEVDHKEGVLEPFNVRVIDRDINRKAVKFLEITWTVKLILKKETRL